MDYDDIELDFVSRTITILEQYDRYVKSAVPTDKQYELTLLLNCLLGLIVTPFETRKRQQGGVREPKVCGGDYKPVHELGREWGLSNLDIATFTIDNVAVPDRKRTLRKIVAMLRHGMAHARFVDAHIADHDPHRKRLVRAYFLNEYSYRDRRSRRDHTVVFSASLPVEDLSKFAVKLAREYLKELGSTG